VIRAVVLLVALVAAGLVGISVPDDVAAQAPTERVFMTPAEGTLHTQFHLVGVGFTPGRTVSFRVLPPDGVERRLRNELGAELVWLVLADGTFSLDLIPAQHFPEAPAGRWRLLFCQFGSLTCQQLEFDVLP
jgi:hypothetical protein